MPFSGWFIFPLSQRGIKGDFLASETKTANLIVNYAPFSSKNVPAEISILDYISKLFPDVFSVYFYLFAYQFWS